VPGDLAPTLVASGDVRAIETDRVPLLAGVEPRLRAAAAIQHGGQDFGVPFAWRPLVVRHRTDLVAPPAGTVLLYVPTKLRDGSPSAGRVQAFDSPLAIAQAALYLAQAQPALGIDDPFALDPDQYAAALALVRAQKPLLHRHWRDRAEQDADFLQGGVAVASGWAGGDWRRASIDPADAAAVAWSAPGEGVIARADSSMLHARAAHPNCAYAWFDWSLEPRVQAQAAHWLGTVPAVPAACSADDRLGQAGCRANGSELLAQARFARAPQATCGRERGCVPYSRWTQDFNAIRGE
jgi:putative spermidine/putrescine transport system substrate-binding protein